MFENPAGQAPATNIREGRNNNLAHHLRPEYGLKVVCSLGYSHLSEAFDVECSDLLEIVHHCSNQAQFLGDGHWIEPPRCHF